MGVVYTPDIADDDRPAHERLCARLDAMGWTLSDLAREIDVNPAILSRLAGGIRGPSLDLAFRIQWSPVGLPAEAWVARDRRQARAA